MKIIVKQFEAEYTDSEERFEKLELLKSKEIEVSFEDTLMQIAVDSLGEEGQYLFPFNPKNDFPLFILDYFIIDGKVVWNTEYIQLSLSDFCVQENIDINTIEELCFVNPSCRGGPEGDITIIIGLIDQINSFMLTHPLETTVIQALFSIISTASWKKLNNYLGGISFEGGASYNSLKKFVYSQNEWKAIDFGYKINADFDVAKEILTLFGYVEEENLFVLKYHVDNK